MKHLKLRVSTENIDKLNKLKRKSLILRAVIILVNILLSGTLLGLIGSFFTRIDSTILLMLAITVFGVIVYRVLFIDGKRLATIVGVLRRDKMMSNEGMGDK